MTQKADPVDLVKLEIVNALQALVETSLHLVDQFKTLEGMSVVPDAPAKTSGKADGDTPPANPEPEQPSSPLEQASESSSNNLGSAADAPSDAPTPPEQTREIRGGELCVDDPTADDVISYAFECVKNYGDSYRDQAIELINGQLGLPTLGHLPDERAKEALELLTKLAAEFESKK